MPFRSIYVETIIRAELDDAWAATQDPLQHVRWDVRFSEIRPTGATEDGAARFDYSRRAIFAHRPRQWRESRPMLPADGTRTSALRFSTPDRWSPIRSGRGYWRYEPAPGGIRFITGYDYEPGWGPLDILVRPVLGWATAWSFDRLRIWLEGGRHPSAGP